MANLNKSGILQKINTLLPDNTNRSISPAKVREVLTDISDSFSNLNDNPVPYIPTETTQATVETTNSTEADKYVSVRRFWQGITRFLALAWTWAEKQTFTTAPRFSSVTASKPLKVDANKDITSGDIVTSDIANNAVTHAKFQQIPANSVVLNNTASTADTTSFVVTPDSLLGRDAAGNIINVPQSRFLNATGVLGNILYVSTNAPVANDSNTRAQAVGRIDKPFKTLLAAINASASGDTISIQSDLTENVILAGITRTEVKIIITNGRSFTGSITESSICNITNFSFFGETGLEKIVATGNIFFNSVSYYFENLLSFSSTAVYNVQNYGGGRRVYFKDIQSLTNTNASCLGFANDVSNYDNVTGVVTTGVAVDNFEYIKNSKITVITGKLRALHTGNCDKIENSTIICSESIEIQGDGNNKDFTNSKFKNTTSTPIFNFNKIGNSGDTLNITNCTFENGGAGDTFASPYGSSTIFTSNINTKNQLGTTSLTYSGSNNIFQNSNVKIV